MESVRRCLGNTTELSKEVQAELSQELTIIRDVLGYKARVAGVRLDIPPSEIIYFPIHPVRLHQLLLNLISNAIDACVQATKNGTNRDEAIVRVRVLKNERNVTLTFEDNGCGMGKEEIDSLLHSRFSTKGSGHGLGFMTVKNIVEDELKGRLEVTSTPHKGTLFTVIVTS